MVEKYCKTKGLSGISVKINKDRVMESKFSCQWSLIYVGQKWFEMKVRRSFAMAMGEQVTGMF